ncbi:hypothetical protein IKF84_00700 [Candidatus Saccharibacteria bacterium]|nr:hypothetical protein [Candidatus Saccharibacteria bacterium]
MNKNHKKNLWIVTVIAIGVIATTGIIFGILAINGVFDDDGMQKVTICTSRDFSQSGGVVDASGSCTQKKTVKIVATPEYATDCPVDTEPVYDYIGGIANTIFVGCTKNQ